MTEARIEEIVANMEKYGNAISPSSEIGDDILALTADWRAKKGEIEGLRKDLEDDRELFSLPTAILQDRAAEAMRAKCEAIARNVDLYDGDRLKKSDPRTTIADAIAALKQS